MELLQTGKTADKAYRDLPESAVNGFLRAFGYLVQVERIEHLYQYKGLHYEHLKGTQYESVRCDRKYRLILFLHKDGEVEIKEIELIKITNHYEHL